MSLAWTLIGAIIGYDVGMALLIYEPVRRIRQYPHNRRVRKENASYVPPPLDERWERAFRELAKANLRGADLRGANLSGALLRP
jgi:Pentapeptide repeats (8 copies)